MGENSLNKLIDLGGKKRVVSLGYRRDGKDGACEERVVEPYNLTNGRGDLLVRCFQVKPDAGWRFFSVKRIESVDDAGEGFSPRVSVTMDSLEVDHRVLEGRGGGPMTPERQYEAMIVDALLDGVVTDEEFAGIEGFASDSGLGEAERMLVHARLLHDCLGAIIADDQIDDREREWVTLLHKTLTRLGWGVVG